MKIKIKPKEGLKVIKPQSKMALKEEGEEVEQSTYWLRRIECGDVILEKPVQQESSKDQKSSKGGK